MDADAWAAHLAVPTGRVGFVNPGFPVGPAG
jgi:hypothetical protein